MLATKLFKISPLLQPGPLPAIGAVPKFASEFPLYTHTLIMESYTTSSAIHHLTKFSPFTQTECFIFFLRLLLINILLQTVYAIRVLDLLIPLLPILTGLAVLELTMFPTSTHAVSILVF